MRNLRKLLIVELRNSSREAGAPQLPGLPCLAHVGKRMAPVQVRPEGSQRYLNMRIVE